MQYSSVEEGVATREALHNLVWPPSNKTRLQVEFATESEAKKFLQGPESKDKKETPKGMNTSSF